jgi:hypothetical protein
MRDVVHESERGWARASTGDPAVGLSRRAFVGGVAAGGAVALAFPHAFALAAEFSSADPVIGFYMDRPYLDLSGTAEPYIGPQGTRSGQVLAGLSATEFLRLHPYG